MTKNSNRKEGYLMVEVFVAICISLIVMSTVNLMLNESVRLIEQTDNRIELMEQFNEIKSSLKRELRNSTDIIFYKDNKNITPEDGFVEVDKIKISRFDDVKNGVAKVKDKSIRVNKYNKKIFISYNGGNYEIGNYAEGIEAKKDSENSFSIKLKLKKNNNQFNDIINIRLRN